MTDTPRLHVVLYQPQIPQNTGAIGRTCVAVGAKLWLVRPIGFHLDEKSLRRAGLDYWQHLPWEVVNDWKTLLHQLPARRMWLFTKTATTCYTDIQYTPNDALVFGSETQGLPRQLIQEHAEQAVRVPMNPVARSLNLSCTVAVATFEALRQWTSAGILHQVPPSQL